MTDRQLAETFVELADTLVDDFDVMDFLHQVTVRCAQVLGVSAAGVLLTDQRGTLQVVAASTEATRLLELLQLLLHVARAAGLIRPGSGSEQPEGRRHQKRGNGPLPHERFLSRTHG